MRISVFGLGYVGAVSVACLARDGHHVIGVDINPQKLSLIKAGKAPIVEGGIQELMRDAVASGRVEVTSDTRQAVLDSDLSFVCVGTPSSQNGAQDISAVLRLSETIGDALRTKAEFHTVVIRSTVAPGIVAGHVCPALEMRSGKKSGTDFGVCFQPEFLREGSSIRDYDNPPFTIVGSDSDRATQMVRQIFEKLPCEFIATEIRTAEMLKIACNAFHALKITFANEIARVAQGLGVDSREVMRLLASDVRLNASAAYLKPGFAFGGSCLPKDLRALTYLARVNDVEVPTLASLIPSNRVHLEHVADKILAQGRRSVCMIGLSFKPGTDDLRESPLVSLAEKLIGKGLKLSVYDPHVHLSRLLGANRQYIEETIPHIASLMCDSLEDAVSASEVIVLGLFDSVLWEPLYRSSYAGQLLVDLVGIPDRFRIAASYWGACW